MRDALRSAFSRSRNYFGLGGEEDGGASLEVSGARATCLRGAQAGALLTVLMTACVLTLFDWDVRAVVVEGLIGTAMWGILYFVVEARGYVPRGALLPPPEEAMVVDARRSRSQLALLLAWAVPTCIGCAWLADRWDLGGAFIPGQLLGMASAYTTAAALIARWERAHRRSVLFREAAGDTELYVARPADAR